MSFRVHTIKTARVFNSVLGMDFFATPTVREVMRKKKTTVLVADGKQQIFRILDIILDRHDYDVVECISGQQAVRLCLSIKPDIILLDPDMPDTNGCALISAIREWSSAPIIVLSEVDGDAQIARSLDTGADDYVIKPFNPDVLRARIAAVMRKAVIQEAGKLELTNGILRMDLVRHEVFIDDQPISFTPKEYNLLRYFIKHRGKMLSHKSILNEVWGPAHGEDTQYLRVFIGHLRRKIESNPAAIKMITTEPGIGYRMEIFDDGRPYRQGEFVV